jgi:signal transduction histidine kinase
METRKNSITQPATGDRRKTPTRRVFGDRRKSPDRRSVTDRRSGWGKIEDELLQGALAATASIVYQLSRPFTIILGYVDLLLAGTKEEYSREKLAVIKNQLEIISRILDGFRDVDDFKTIDFDGIDILDTNKLQDVKSIEKEHKTL